MLRFWLLGGARWTLPWEFFVTMAGAFFGASALFVLLFPLWSTYPLVGFIEFAVLAGAGSAFLAAGLRRRARPDSSSGRVR